MRYLAQEWTGENWVTLAEFVNETDAERFVEVSTDECHHWRVYGAHV